MRWPRRSPPIWASRPTGLRPRFAAAAALAAISIAKAQARSVHGATASRTQAVAVLDQAAAFLEGGLAAIGATPARRRTA